MLNVVPGTAIIIPEVARVGGQVCEAPLGINFAHKGLDEAIFAAYGWNSDLSDEEILEKLLVPGSLCFPSGVLRKSGEGE